MKTAVMRITVHELCERQGLSRNVLLELVEHDIARPVAGSTVDDWVFDCGSAHWLDAAVRLRRDLDLDWIAVAMLVDLLHAIGEAAGDSASRTDEIRAAIEDSRC